MFWQLSHFWNITTLLLFSALPTTKLAGSLFGVTNTNFSDTDIQSHSDHYKNSLWNNTKPVGPLQWFRIGNYHKPQYSKVKQPLIPDKTCPDKAWKALVRSKTSQWLAVFIDVHTRGVCQLVDISFNLVYILRLYPSGLLGEVKECIIFGVATWLGRTPLIKGLLCFTQLCLV